MNDNSVSDYGWNSDQGPESCGYITPRIVELLQELNLRRVLDLGSGNGTLCGVLATMGYEVAGVEYDRSGVELARNAYPSIPFYRVGVQDDPDDLILKAEKPFDVVVSTEVIEHLFSPHLLPSFAGACLSPGGYLIISTPYHGYLKNLALSIFNKWDTHHTPLWHGGHIKFWSRRTLTQLLAENGFRVVNFSGVGRVAYLWKSMVLVAKRVQ